jgi:hypothetical protein
VTENIVDILFLVSVLLLLTGFMGLFIRPVRSVLKKMNKNFRLRHCFFGFLLFFFGSLAIGWEDVVRDFQEGFNEERLGGSDVENNDIDP